MADGELIITVRDDNTVTALQRKLSYLLDDWEVQEGVTRIVVDAVTKYVPKLSGNLAEHVEIEGEEAVWTEPYAHYQHEGFVYGPNKAVWAGNSVVGWYTPKGTEKFPTGRMLGEARESFNGWDFGYTTSGTGHHWIDKMWENENDRRVTNIKITNYLKRMAREKDL